MSVSPSTVSLAPGATRQLTATVLDGTGEPVVVDLAYTTSDAAVATVSTNGLITSVAEGSATITVSPVGYPAVAATVAVTVVLGATARPYGRLFDGRDQFPGFVPAGTSETTTVALPESFIDTTVPDTTGWTHQIVVTNETEYLAAITTIGADNGEILLAPTFDADQIPAAPRVFDANGVRPSTVIWVRPQTPPTGFPAPGQLMTPSIGEQLPTIRVTAGGGGMALRLCPNSESSSGFTPGDGRYFYGFRFTGIRLLQDTSSTTEALCRTSCDSWNIVFDRIYARARDNQTVCRRAFWMDGGHNAVVDSWIEDMKDLGTDAQAIMQASGTGPLKIVGCVLEASGEPFIAGGIDPRLGSDETLPYQPRDLEFRRNFCRLSHRWNRRHPACLSIMSYRRGPFPVASYDAATDVLTLGSGTFDTTECYDASAAGGNYRRLWTLVVTSGTGAGSWAFIDSYPSDTSASLYLNWQGGVAPDATSQVEVRMGNWFAGKNCFELKNMRRAYIAECVFEGGWDGDGQQYHALNLKSVNQGGGVNGALCKTEDVTVVDCIIGNCYGGAMFARNPQGPVLPAERFHLDNILIRPSLNTAYHGGAGNKHAPLQINVDDIHFSRITSQSYQYGWIVVIDGSSSTTPDLTDLTMDRVLGTHTSPGVVTVRNSTGYGTGPGPFAEVVDTSTLRWDNCGVAGTTSKTKYVDGTAPAPGPWTTHFTSDAAPWVNPTTDFWGAADWSLKSADALGQLAEADRPGCDWPDLQARTNGVRPSAALLPEEW